MKPIDVGRFSLSDKNTSRWQSMSMASNCAKEIYEFNGTRIIKIFIKHFVVNTSLTAFVADRI